ncbi:MAG: PrsW family glutamic-type intramembrane protease [Planctomycetota bacterium]
MGRRPPIGHGVEDEPHLAAGQWGAAQPDKSEAKAESRLASEKTPDDAEAAMSSVHEEPAFRASAGTFIDRDWPCDACGYNLRGQRVGGRCPECGAIISLAPPAEDQRGYAAWLDRRIARTTERATWWTTFWVALLGGPWAVLGALLTTWGGLWAVVLIAPVVEEAMKIALIAWVIEKCPYRFRRRSQLVLAALGSGLAFATIENVLYLFVYIPDPSPEIIAWRLVVCTALHVGCTAVAAVGAVRAWDRVMQHRRPAAVPVDLAWLGLAIGLHAAYNTAVTFAELTGLAF